MLAPGALSGLVISPWGPHQPTAGWASLRSTFISAALGLHPDEAVGLTVWSVCAQCCLGGPHSAARRSVLVANALLLVCLLLWRGSCVVSGGGGGVGGGGGGRLTLQAVLFPASLFTASGLLEGACWSWGGPSSFVAGNVFRVPWV